MTSRRLTCFLGLCATLGLGGCAGSSDLDDPDHARAWANSGSALAAFLPAYEPLAIAEGQRVPPDPACPRVEDDGATARISGGCLDSAGTEWVGAATVTRDGGFAVALDGFGEAEEDPARVDGAIRITRTGPDAYTWEADYAQDGLVTLDVDYGGALAGGWEGPTVWSGSGTVTRGGFTDAAGTSAVTTVDQVRDPACGNQSWSGTTTVEHGGRTLVIEYDGETDCDDDSTARYSVDGEDRGALDGVSCAAAPGRGAPAVAPGLGLALALLIRRRPGISARGRGARCGRRGRGRRSPRRAR